MYVRTFPRNVGVTCTVDRWMSQYLDHVRCNTQSYANTSRGVITTTR